MAMVGVIAGNVRTIALSTLVTVLIPQERRDRANGLVGMATGVSFLVTSVISGVLVAAGDMFYVLLLAMARARPRSRAPGTDHRERPGRRRRRSPMSRRIRLMIIGSTCVAPSGWFAASRACWP